MMGWPTVGVALAIGAAGIALRRLIRAYAYLWWQRSCVFVEEVRLARAQRRLDKLNARARDGPG